MHSLTRANALRAIDALPRRANFGSRAGYSLYFVRANIEASESFNSFRRASRRAAILGVIQTTREIWFFRQTHPGPERCMHRTMCRDADKGRRVKVQRRHTA